MGATQQENQEPTIERRSIKSDFEIRSAENGSVILFGYALKWGVVYDMGFFTEEVHRDALSKSDISDVRALQNHNVDIIIGRTLAGTARVWTDEIGLAYEADLPNSPMGQNLRVAIERGDITQSSWGFSFRRDSTGRRTGDRWEIRDGKEHRIITDVERVFDVSPVTFPANPDTSVAKRSLEMWKQEQIEEQTQTPDLSDMRKKLEYVFSRKQEINKQ